MGISLDSYSRKATEARAAALVAADPVPTPDTAPDAEDVQHGHDVAKEITDEINTGHVSYPED